MTLRIELSAEEYTALSEQADAAGVDVETILHRLIAPLVRPETEKTGTPRGAQQRAAPTTSSQAYGPVSDPEEIADQERERAEMQNNIVRWRTEQEKYQRGAG